MLPLLAFVAALGTLPGQSSALTLAEVRSTYGSLGAPRPDNKVLPGDSFVLSFLLKGVQVDQGKALYSIAMEVDDASGKSQFKQAPKQLEAAVPPGGDTLAASARVDIGLDQPPGTYSVKVTATDRRAQATQEVTRSFEVLPKDLGIVRLTMTSDREGRVPAPVSSEGKPLYFTFATVGFGRDPSTSQPDLSLTLRVLDGDGRQALTKPPAGHVNKDIPPTAPGIPMQFMVQLKQAGNYVVELKANDRVTGKTATVSFPVVVVKMKDRGA